MRKKVFGMRKTWLIVFAATLFAFSALSAPTQAAVTAGQAAPPLVLEQLDGKTFDLATLKGKVVLVHFWATWCAPCKEEMPVLDAFYRQHHADGLELIAVSADASRHRDDVKDAMKGFAFPAAMLGDVSTNGFGKPTAIPVTYIVDASGIVRSQLMPDETTLTKKQIEDVVMPLMGR